VIQQLKKRPKLIVLDTMNFWMDIAMDDLLKTLAMIDVLTINDSEARQLSGEYSLVKAARKILKMGPKVLVIKKGEHGVLFYNGSSFFSLPAYPAEKVVDPTGAGDTGGCVDNDAFCLDNTRSDQRCQCKTCGSDVTAWCGDELRRTKLFPVDLRKAVYRVLDQFWVRMFEPIPLRIKKSIFEAVGSRQIDDQSHFLVQLRY
jgi:hypothetical protein